MADLNRVDIRGHLGRDPEIRSFANGGKVANLRIATTRKWKDRDGNVQEETEWHSVAVTAEGLVGVVEQYARKGSLIHVTGRLRTRKWQDQSGADRYSTEILVAGYDSRFDLLPSGRRDDTQGGPSGQSGGAQSRQDPDDEIPF